MKADEPEPVSGCDRVSTRPLVPLTAAFTLGIAVESVMADPANPSDGAALARNGYTNLENYLSELAGDPIP